jgi:hypothetical protein
MGMGRSPNSAGELAAAKLAGRGMRCPGRVLISGEKGRALIM